jgi:hypothetical protein
MKFKKTESLSRDGVKSSVSCKSVAW